LLEGTPYILELSAGLCFVAAGIALLRLAKRTRETPERLLGITFSLMGVSYFFYELPFATATEDLLVPLSVCGRLTWNASIVFTALFTQHVFHPGQAWSRLLPWSASGLIALGLLVSIAYGDWDGMAPRGNPGFWIEFAGQLIPFGWVACVAGAETLKARRRMSVGLSDALLCNRFLLFAMFGSLQFLTILLVAVMYMGFEAGEGFSTGSDVLLGSIEIASVLAIWLAFFPPDFYRRWVTGSAHEGA